MMNAIIPKEHSAHNINKARKSIVGLCYMIAGLRNKFVNQHKLEVGLYLMASDATWEAVDTMSSLGYADNIKERKEERPTKGLQLVELKEQSLHSVQDYIKEHLTCFTEFFVENIHSKIRANTSQNAIVDNIIKQAYVIMNHNWIFKNVKFLEQIEKGADTLTEEDVDDDDEDDVENVKENSGEVETIDISASLAAQIEQTKYW
ncbi:hypothetical protein C2G38_2151667 [Gigaspora rosea]|uniref:Uncharacterized protein n=1 Tax=Gigaspora rosea TaxID=44941 RepID=A0A397W821_9GLOM|nr:hypothetical protein C2G38_2151667 [Gigaspora rosea]